MVRPMLFETINLTAIHKYFIINKSEMISR